MRKYELPQGAGDSEPSSRIIQPPDRSRGQKRVLKNVEPQRPTSSSLCQSPDDGQLQWDAPPHTHTPASLLCTGLGVYLLHSVSVFADRHYEHPGTVRNVNLQVLLQID